MVNSPTLGQHEKHGAQYPKEKTIIYTSTLLYTKHKDGSTADMCDNHVKNDFLPKTWHLIDGLDQRMETSMRIVLSSPWTLLIENHKCRISKQDVTNQGHSTHQVTKVTQHIMPSNYQCHLTHYALKLPRSPNTTCSPELPRSLLTTCPQTIKVTQHIMPQNYEGHSTLYAPKLPRSLVTTCL